MRCSNTLFAPIETDVMRDHVRRPLDGDPLDLTVNAARRSAETASTTAAAVQAGLISFSHHDVA